MHLAVLRKLTFGPAGPSAPISPGGPNAPCKTNLKYDVMRRFSSFGDRNVESSSRKRSCMNLKCGPGVV